MFVLPPSLLFGGSPSNSRVSLSGEGHRRHYPAPLSGRVPPPELQESPEGEGIRAAKQQPTGENTTPRRGGGDSQRPHAARAAWGETTRQERGRAAGTGARDPGAQQRRHNQKPEQRPSPFLIFFRRPGSLFPTPPASEGWEKRNRGDRGLLEKPGGSEDGQNQQHPELRTREQQERPALLRHEGEKKEKKKKDREGAHEPDRGQNASPPRST